jgi:y4mF family transcriptional regulator
MKNFLIGVILTPSPPHFPIGKNCIVLGKTSCTVSRFRRCSMYRSARDFGAAVREKRKARGWTQTELAARSGTGERFVVELESGKPSCQLEKSLVVARAVGIEIGDLNTVRSVPASSDDGLDFLPTFGDGR